MGSGANFSEIKRQERDGDWSSAWIAMVKCAQSIFPLPRTSLRRNAWLKRWNNFILSAIPLLVRNNVVYRGTTRGVRLRAHISIRNLTRTKRTCCPFILDVQLFPILDFFNGVF
jgi:hypothetical protein